jgi:hypothetical protein
LLLKNFCNIILTWHLCQRMTPPPCLNDARPRA